MSVSGDFLYAVPIGEGEGQDSVSYSELRPRSCSAYIFEAAHEVVADGRSWQVGRVQAAPDVEEII